jgi:hypothetical protein
MFTCIEQAWAWLDAKIAPIARLNRYEVTPRQGRYIIRRKLLRALNQRFRLAQQDRRVARFLQP